MTQEGCTLSWQRTLGFIQTHFAAIFQNPTSANMSSATTFELTSPSPFPAQSTLKGPQNSAASRAYNATQWATLLREAFVSLPSSPSRAAIPCLRNAAFNAPRRRHADPRSGQLAAEIATLLYPAPLDAGLSQLIKYGQLLTASYPLSFCAVYAHDEIVPSQLPSSQGRCGFFN